MPARTRLALGARKPLKKLVRMKRLELLRPLQALEPKSSASANSATSARPVILFQRNIDRFAVGFDCRKARNSRESRVSCGNVAITCWSASISA
jgi:hypothetical protein